MGSGEQAAVLKRQPEKAMKREFAKHMKRGGCGLQSDWEGNNERCSLKEGKATLGCTQQTTHTHTHPLTDTSTLMRWAVGGYSVRLTRPSTHVRTLSRKHGVEGVA